MKKPVSLAAGLLFLLTAPAPAQEAAPGRFVALLPELAEMPAPEWVKPGVRMTTYGAAASTRESRHALVEDPDGTWVDPRTGKKYRDDAGSGIENPTASGEGYGQLDVVAVEGRRVVAMVQLYLLDRTRGAIFPTTGIPLVGTAANLEDYWVHPKALEKLVGLEAEGLRVLRGPMQLGERVHDAIRIESRAGGTTSIHTYDAATGILLRSSSVTPGKFDPVRLPGEPQPRQGNTQRTITLLAGVRELRAPLAGGRMPEWVGRTTSMRYAGQTHAVNPIDGSSLGVHPTELEATLAAGGGGWRAYRTAGRIVIGGMPSPFEDAGVAAGVGPFWADPGALAGLEEGAVLDEDPITGVRVVVGRAARTPDGKRTLALVASNATYSLATTYDVAAGTLLEAEIANRATGMTTRIALRSVR